MRVAVDVTPLWGTPTGVATFVAGASGALARRSDVELVRYALSGRALLRGRARAFPAAVGLAAWRRVDWPPAEWLTGSVDVVHGTNFVVPPARHAGRVVTVHDLTAVRFPELCAPASRRYPALVRRAIDRGAVVHTPSRFVAEEVCEVFDAPPERVHAVAHGVDTVAGEPSAPPLVGDARFVLALGTVEPRKDLPLLVGAFDRIAAGRVDVRLVIAGPDGWGSGTLNAAVADAAHGDRIIRVGFVDRSQRAALLGGATVFAYPSRYEGFGLPVLEAMAAGTPVVTTSAGALPEVAGDAALLVPPGDVDALAGALATVLDDPPVAAEFAHRGVERAASFSWERCAAGLYGVYQAAAP